MRSDIDTLKSFDCTKEEREFILNYFRYVRKKMNYPTHPEINIGDVRYPLGRFILRTGVVPEYVLLRERFAETRTNLEIKQRILNHLDEVKKVHELTKSIRQRGKTIKKEKRKDEREAKKTNNRSTQQDVG